MKLWKTILLAVGLSGAFLFVIYFSASAKEPERAVQHFALPYQVIEILPNGEPGQTYSGQSLKTKPIEIAAELGAAPYPEDQFTAFPDYKDFVGRKITLYRAPSYIVYDQNNQTLYRSFAQTVGQLLAEKNIVLGNDDKINFSVDTELTPNMTIKIIRVAITTLVETETIDFQIQNKDDPNLDYGKKRVVAGVKGEKKLTYRVKRENGVEVEKTLLDSRIIKGAQTEIHYSGTKVTVISSVSGKATMTPVSNYVVSPNYSRGTLIRITNRSNGISLMATVNATWGTASSPDGVVLDLAPNYLSQLKCSSSGCPNVLVEEIKQ